MDFIKNNNIEVKDVIIEGNILENQKSYLEDIERIRNSTITYSELYLCIYDIKDFLLVCFEPFVVIDNLDNLVLSVCDTTITIYGTNSINFNFIEINNYYKSYCDGCGKFNKIKGDKIFNRDGFDYRCSCGFINSYLLLSDENYLYNINSKDGEAYNLTKKFAMNRYSIEYSLVKLIHDTFSFLLVESFKYFVSIRIDELYYNMLDIEISLPNELFDSIIKLEYRLDIKDTAYNFRLFDISLTVDDMDSHSMMFENYKKVVDIEDNLKVSILNIIKSYLKN